MKEIVHPVFVHLYLKVGGEQDETDNGNDNKNNDSSNNSDDETIRARITEHLASRYSDLQECHRRHTKKLMESINFNVIPIPDNNNNNNNNNNNHNQNTEDATLHNNTHRNENFESTSPGYKDRRRRRRSRHDSYDHPALSVKIGSSSSSDDNNDNDDRSSFQTFILDVSKLALFMAIYDDWELSDNNCTNNNNDNNNNNHDGLSLSLPPPLYVMTQWWADLDETWWERPLWAWPWHERLIANGMLLLHDILQNVFSETPLQKVRAIVSNVDNLNNNGYDEDVVKNLLLLNDTRWAFRLVIQSPFPPQVVAETTTEGPFEDDDDHTEVLLHEYESMSCDDSSSIDDESSSSCNEVAEEILHAQDRRDMTNAPPAALGLVGTSTTTLACCCQEVDTTKIPSLETDTDVAHVQRAAPKSDGDDALLPSTLKDYDDTDNHNNPYINNISLSGPTAMVVVPVEQHDESKEMTKGSEASNEPSRILLRSDTTLDDDSGKTNEIPNVEREETATTHDGATTTAKGPSPAPVAEDSSSPLANAEATTQKRKTEELDSSSTPTREEVEQTLPLDNDSTHDDGNAEGTTTNDDANNARDLSPRLEDSILHNGEGATQTNDTKKVECTSTLPRKQIVETLPLDDDTNDDEMESKTMDVTTRTMAVATSSTMTPILRNPYAKQKETTTQRENPIHLDIPTTLLAAETRAATDNATTTATTTTHPLPENVNKIPPILVNPYSRKTALKTTIRTFLKKRDHAETVNNNNNNNNNKEFRADPVDPSKGDERLEGGAMLFGDCSSISDNHADQVTNIVSRQSSPEKGSAKVTDEQVIQLSGVAEICSKEPQIDRNGIDLTLLSQLPAHFRSEARLALALQANQKRKQRPTSADPRLRQWLSTSDPSCVAGAADPQIKKFHHVKKKIKRSIADFFTGS